jgi:hypothetical protein
MTRKEKYELRIFSERKKITLKPVHWIGIGTAIFLFLLPLVFYLISNMQDTDEKRIKKQFKEARKAVLDIDIDKLGELFSDDFYGISGTNKADAMKIADKVLNQLEDFKIRILYIDVTILGEDKAELYSDFEFSGYWTGSGMYNRIPLSGGLPGYLPGECRIKLIKEDGSWKILHIELKLNQEEYRGM